MADDADRAADLDVRLAAARVPAEPVMFFSCFPVEEKRPRKVVLASFAPRWTAAGWKVTGDAGPDKVAIEWPGDGEPAMPGGSR